MDIMGLSRRLFDQLGQTANQIKTKASEQVDDAAGLEPDRASSSALSARLQSLADQFDVHALPVSELIPLQEALKQQGFIGESQVRAQGLLPQLAYHHYEAGPMDVEQALESHLERLRDKPVVLADHHEGRHMLNLVRNLASARSQTNTAA